MRKYFFLAVLISLLAGASARAACTGSGTTWNCPAGATTTDVQNVINSATDGAVVTFAVGSYTWSSAINFSSSRGITLICATANLCTPTTSGVIFHMSGIAANAVITKLYRVSGFSFTTANTSTGIFWFEPACSPCHAEIDNIRIDHNTFHTTQTDNAHIVFCGDTGGSGGNNLYCYGVIDHNTFNADHQTAVFFPVGWFDNPAITVSHSGKASNMFLEDNTLTVTLNTNGSEECFTDGWGFGATVSRHNTIINCLALQHDLGHDGGPSNYESYNNQHIINSGINGQTTNDGYRMFHHQGSQEEMFWNNSFTPISEPHNSAMLSVVAGYVDTLCTPQPYPCPPNPNPSPGGTNGAQPGYDSGMNQKPIYVWGNFSTLDNSLVRGGNESNGTYVAENRDLYNALATGFQTSPTSPFNGTVGVGVGSLANRPTSCTVGVGYVVESVVGTIGASSGSGVASDAVLYRCTATNTWTLWYQPYTYPHPLTVGGGGGTNQNGSCTENLTTNASASVQRALNSNVTENLTTTSSISGTSGAQNVRACHPSP